MKSFSFAPIAMLVLAGALAGCGTDATNPTENSLTTDTAAPSAPSALSSSFDNVAGVDVLQWSASPEADLSGYEIYLYSPDPARSNSYVLAGAVSASQTSFPMRHSGGGNEFYRVRAFDGEGNRSAESAVHGVTRRANEVPVRDTDQPGGGRDFGD